MNSFRLCFCALLLLHFRAKLSFFHDENRANIFEVDPESGMLLNTDNGTHMPRVDSSLRLPLKSLGRNVLYVGDHIYGVRSKEV